MATLNQLFTDKARIEGLLIESGGELTPEVIEAMDINETNIKSKIDSYHSVMLQMDYGSDEIDKEIKRLQALKKTKQNAVKSLKDRLLFLMDEAGLDRVDGNLCKAFVRASAPSVVVGDDFLTEYETSAAALGFPEYIKVSVWVDKTLLKNAMQTSDVPGASFTQSRSVVIK